MRKLQCAQGKRPCARSLGHVKDAVMIPTIVLSTRHAMEVLRQRHARVHRVFNVQLRHRTAGAMH